MTLDQLISTYGYAAIGLGTFLEGETVLVLGGFAAHRGYLELPWVILTAFVGTLLGDQLYFYIGRAKGEHILDRKPHWRPKAERVFAMLHRHQNWMILGFRFLYGLRTITPFLIGAAGVSPLRFLLLNATGGAVWAVSVGTLGFFFGHAIDLLIGDIKRYELIFFAVVGGGAALAWSVRAWRRRRALAEALEQEPPLP